jgi:hypothetical protein
MPATIFRKTDGSWTANGHMPLEDLVQYVPLPLDEKREYHTIAGLLMEYLQRIPTPGRGSGRRLSSKTLEVESHRVQKVQIIALNTGDAGLSGLTGAGLPALQLLSSFFRSLPFWLSLLRSAHSFSRRFASSCKCLRKI